jgi:hypothetical protein
MLKNPPIFVAEKIHPWMKSPILIMGEKSHVDLWENPFSDNRR